MSKYGPRLRHARNLKPSVGASLPVTVTSQLDSFGLQVLCALESGEMPDIQHIACIPDVLTGASSNGRPTLSALMNLSWPQIESLAASHDVTHIELAL